MKKMQKINKKRVFATVALMIIAVTTIAYAQMTMGTLTVTTTDLAAVSVGSMSLGTIPNRSAASKIFDNATTITTGDSSFVGVNATVKCEVLVGNADILKAFRSLVIEIRVSDGVANTAGGTVKARLSLNSPYDEFELTLPDVASPAKYDVVVTCNTGEKTLTSATFSLSVDIV